MLWEGSPGKRGIFQAEGAAGAKPSCKSVRPAGGTGKRPAEAGGESRGRGSWELRAGVGVGETERTPALSLSEMDHGSVLGEGQAI